MLREETDDVSLSEVAAGEILGTGGKDGNNILGSM